MVRDLALVVGLVVATLAVYSATLQNDFVSFDDPNYITANTHVREGLTWEGLRWSFSRFHSDNWHPLTWISHMVDVELFGLDARGHHAVGALIHALNAALLFAALSCLTRERWPSAFVAALFALHPLRVESVAWASERKDLLSGFFFFLILLAYSRYVHRRTSKRYAVVVLLFALGLLTKPVLVTIPILLLFLDFWPLERGDSLLPSRRLLLEKLPLIGLAIASSLVTLLAQSTGGSLQSLDSIPLIERVSNAAISYVAYLGQTLWPLHLAFFYPHPSLVSEDEVISLGMQAAMAGLGLVTLSYWILRNAKTRPYLAVGWGWYVIGLLPIIGIVQVGIQARADRYTYLPLIGIAIALSWWIRDLRRDWLLRRVLPESRLNALIGVGAAIVLLGLSLQTQRQIGVWRNSGVLYAHALEVTDSNYIAEHNLGALAGSREAYEAAADHYRRALELRPDYAASHSNLGVTLGRLGRRPEALEHYLEAVRLQPELAQAHVNLGSHYLEEEDFERAHFHYRRAIESRPDWVLVIEVLAELEERLGNPGAAIGLYEGGLEIQPRSPRLHTKLAVTLERNGEGERALDHYRKALQSSPELLPAANGLAWMLATYPDESLRDGREALRLSEQCNRATRFLNATFLRTHAAAHAELQKFDDAIVWQKRAIELTPVDRRPSLRIELEQYEARAPEPVRDGEQ